MAVPGVNFTIAPAQTPTPHTVDDTVFVAGVPLAAGTAVVGELYEGDGVADFDDLIGAGASDLRDAIEGIYSQVSPHVIFTAIPQSVATYDEPPVVTTSGAGVDAVVSDMQVSNTGQITDVTWADGGSGYAVGDTITFTQGTATGTYTLLTEDVETGVLQHLAGKTIGTGFSRPSIHLVNEALDLAYNADPPPTLLHLAGEYTAIGNATAANAHVTRLSQIAENLECRAVANAAQDTIANAVAWGNNNGGSRVIGVFNEGVRSAGVYTYPAGPWIGAVLAIAQEHGRAWGINLAEIVGQTSVRHDLTPFSTSTLTNLDNAGVSTIVADRGVEKIIGDEFSTASPTDAQRFWSVARVVDHVERTLTEAARGFISSTYSADRIAIQLTRHLNPLIAAGEILGGVVVPDLAQEQGTHKYFLADIDILFATNIVTIRLNLVV